MLAGNYVPGTYWEWQSPLLDNLRQKYPYRIAQPKAARFQHRSSLRLEIVIDSSSYNTLFHGTHCSYNVDQSQPPSNNITY